MELIQNWGIAFRGTFDLIKMTRTYEELKQEGYVFPPIDRSQTSFAIIDTKTVSEDISQCSIVTLELNSANQHHRLECTSTRPLNGQTAMFVRVADKNFLPSIANITAETVDIRTASHVRPKNYHCRISVSWKTSEFVMAAI